jgi:hypothetical protein
VKLPFQIGNERLYALRDLMICHGLLGELTVFNDLRFEFNAFVFDGMVRNSIVFIRRWK